MATKDESEETKEGLIPQATDLLGKVWGKAADDLGEVIKDVAGSDIIDNTIEIAIGSDYQQIAKDFTFGREANTETAESGSDGVLKTATAALTEQVSNLTTLAASFLQTAQGNQINQQKQSDAANSAADKGDKSKKTIEQQITENAKDTTQPQNTNSNTGKIGTFLSRMTDKFLPGLKNTANMTLLPYTLEWQKLGKEFGSDNIEITTPGKDKNGNELEGPSMFDTIMMLASYDGEGKLPMPKGIVNMVKGIMSFFAPKGPDGSSIEVTDAAAANMLVGFTRWALSALGMDDLIRPGNPTGQAPPQLSKEKLNNVTDILGDPSTLLETLKKLSAVEIDIAKSLPEYLTAAKLTLQNSGIAVPDEFTGTQVSTKDFIIGYAKSGNAMAAKKGWDNTPSPEILKASEDILQQAGSSDPELARGLAVMAENGTKVVNILKSIFTPDASPDLAQKNVPAPDF